MNQSCSAHRLNSSPLCGQCEPGYVQYPGSSACIHCERSDGGMATVILLLSWLFVLAVLWLSGGENAHTAELKIAAFFLSSARVILGSSSNWTEWLRLFEGGGLTSSLATCVFALSPYDLSMLQLMFPFITFLQLAFTACIVAMLVRLGFVSLLTLSLNRFIRATCVLMMFRSVDRLFQSCTPRLTRLFYPSV